MANKQKHTLRMTLGTSKQGNQRYASGPINIKELMKTTNAISCQFSTQDIGGEEFDLAVESPFGDRINELRLTDDNKGAFLSLWHRAGKSSKSGKEYSFYSSENLDLMDLQSRLGDQIRIFVGKSKSTNPKAAPYYLLISTNQGRGGGGDSRRQGGNQQGAAASEETY